MLQFRTKYPNHKDGELLELYRESLDPEVLGELYSRYMHLVYGVALKYLQNREDARDTVMDIFEKLLLELSKREVQQFKSWLYVLTRNHCLMQIRAEKSTDRQFDSYKKEEEFMESVEDVHPIDRNEPSMEQVLKECIERLKTEQRACIEAFYYRKLCYQEIAGELELTEKKVKSYLQNGKRNLKICLEQKNVD